MLCRLRRVDVADWSKKFCREPIKICQDKLGEISNALEVNKQKFADWTENFVICRLYCSPDPISKLQILNFSECFNQSHCTKNNNNNQL